MADRNVIALRGNGVPRRGAGRLLLWGALLVLATREARAYTDPGSGALLWQMLMAGFVGCLFYFRRFALRFKSRKKRKTVNYSV